MENMARLAQIEHYVNNDKKYENFLNELLRALVHIVENPHDPEFRRLQSDDLKNLLDCKDFCEYLKYLGFVQKNEEFVLPNEQSIEKIEGARDAVERKMTYCYGSKKIAAPLRQHYHKKVLPIRPANILTTSNRFLLSIQSLFNDMLKYESEELLEAARAVIPMMSLQLRALDRMREHQKKIKTGDIGTGDLSYDMALLAELLSWFRHKFFKWTDKPPCPLCGAHTWLVRREKRAVMGEFCLVEVYDCTKCVGKVDFPRHNDPRILLKTRCGRCGEFTNCFALLCRALGYDVRYVCDNADHVWCEVWDYSSNSWIHIDPSECKMDAPLIYTCGWGKKFAYVIAASREECQDVTWRYTCNFKEVMPRRNLCTEEELISALMALREARQQQVSAPRRRFLTVRTLRELVHMMQERKPEEYESEGRISGSLEWRTQRGETGAKCRPHVFIFDKPGDYSLVYYTGEDRYALSFDGTEVARIAGWWAGVFRHEQLFRKEEVDWKQAYLARRKGAEKGMLTWKLEVSDPKELVFESLTIKATTAVYENGQIEWTLQFDDEEPMVIEVDGEQESVYKRRFQCAVLSASLSGGRGDVAWQHAQLFRQSLDATEPSAELCARVGTTRGQ